MWKKGFTLVELLAVIVILAIILAIAIPGISGIIKSSTKNAFESDAKMVLKAIDYKKLEVENFDAATLNKGNINTLLGLADVNYDSISIVVEDNIPIISIVGAGKWDGLVACGSYHNMKIVENASECGSDLVPPVITVLGTNPVNLFIGGSYSDEGATALDNNDGDITSSIVTTGSVNPNVAGTYTITYSVTDVAGNNAVATRTVNVIDNAAPVITLLGSSSVTIEQGSTYTDAGATALDGVDGDISANIIVTGTVNTSVLGTYTITYNVSDSSGNAAAPVTRTVIVEPIQPISGPGYIESKGVNGPVLAAGMTPIKWDGTTLVNTTTTDSDWYDYTTTDKKWANAKTADGSMWVWIPRYVYKISSGWHNNVAGTIDIQFSIATDDTRGGTVTLDTGTTSNASNSKWTNHPAFTFGTTELTGIWVGKFQSSGTSDAIDIKPNVSALRSISVNDIFNGTRAMEMQSRYGWGATGSGIDTHMMKNVEWGAAAYLSKSAYGKATDIWYNNSNHITGCAGDSADASQEYSCISAYDTANGQQGSTTGTIFGIYDMSGGSWQYVAAYTNKSCANDYGASLYTADPKYKDIYTITTDDETNNYNNAIDKKGDAIYETSDRSVSTIYGSWNGDYSNIPYSCIPWFIRGGDPVYNSPAGIFAFDANGGMANANMSFRVVLATGEGL